MISGALRGTPCDVSEDAARILRPQKGRENTNNTLSVPSLWISNYIFTIIWGTLTFPSKWLSSFRKSFKKVIWLEALSSLQPLTSGSWSTICLNCQQELRVLNSFLPKTGQAFVISNLYASSNTNKTRSTSFSDPAMLNPRNWLNQLCPTHAHASLWSFQLECSVFGQPPR